MTRVPAGTKRPVVEGSLSIDVRRWHRDGLLYAGRSFTWTWSSDGETLGEIGVAVETDAVSLSFDWRRRGANEWARTCQLVPIVWTRCHIGGARLWFLC